MYSAIIHRLEPAGLDPRTHPPIFFIHSPFPVRSSFIHCVFAVVHCCSLFVHSLSALTHTVHRLSPTNSTPCGTLVDFNDSPRTSLWDFERLYKSLCEPYDTINKLNLIHPFTIFHFSLWIFYCLDFSFFIFFFLFVVVLFFLPILRFCDFAIVRFLSISRFRDFAISARTMKSSHPWFND